MDKDIQTIDKRFKIILIIVFLLITIDILTTIIGIRIGLEEATSIVKQSIGKFGLMKAMGLKFLLSIALFLIYNKGYSFTNTKLEKIWIWTIPMVVIGIVYLRVAILNIIEIVKWLN